MSNMSSLFRRLQSYRPREGKDPKEDFFTEALGYVLARNPKVLKEYIKFLIKEKFPNIDPVDKSIDIETQRTFKDRRPDAVITFEDDTGQCYMIICEHKLGAEINIQQLEKYRDILQEHIRSGDIKEGILVLITLWTESHPDFVKHYFRWPEIYKKLEEWGGSAEESPKEVYKEFLIYMEELGMKRPTKFTALEMAEFCRIPGLIESLDECIKNGKAWAKFESIKGETVNLQKLRDYPMRLYWKRITYKVELNMGFCLDAHHHRWYDLLEFGDPDYPELVIFLSSSVRNKLRKKQLEFCRRFADSSCFNSWKTIGKSEKTWMVITHRSMRDFIMDGNDQIENIQGWFADRLQDLKKFMDENGIPSEA